MTKYAYFAAILLLIPLTVWAGSPINTANPDAIAEVTAGTRSVANAAWWGFDAADATDCLQSAIDSGAKTVIVPFVGADWIVRPLRLRSDLEMQFEPGVVVMAKEGEFKGGGDSLFAAADCKNIVLRGYGATLRMRKADYQTEAYKPAEWRMTLRIIGCTNVTIEGLRLESSGGDGVYLGVTSTQRYCENVIIRDVICHDHHRQGISVISAKNLLIENCVFSNTDGTAPQAAIDLEPNHADEQLSNIIVRNCQMLNNTGPGILLYLKHLNAETAPMSVLFENCLVDGAGHEGLVIGALKDDGPGGTIDFRNCIVKNAKGFGLLIYDKSPDTAFIRFQNCHWQANKLGEAGKENPEAPLRLKSTRPEQALHLGSIEFIDCYIHDSLPRQPIDFRDFEKGDGSLRNVNARFYVDNENALPIALPRKTEQVQVKVTAL